jgi:hypothetical protein
VISDTPRDLSPLPCEVLSPAELQALWDFRRLYGGTDRYIDYRPKCAFDAVPRELPMLEFATRHEINWRRWIRQVKGDGLP